MNSVMTPTRCPRALALAAALACAAPAVLAQTPAAQIPAAPDAAASAPEAPLRGRVDLGLSGARLTAGESNWFDQYARGFVVVKPGTTVNWDLNHERHFGERGTVGALALTQDLSTRWYALAGMSFGSASFQAKRRVDLGLYRKWGADQRWVTGLVYMNSRSNDDIHRDQGLTASLAYHAPRNWVAEGGLVFNRSNPGSVTGTRGFVALTQGREKSHYLVLRLDHGKEAYLPEAALQSPSQGNVAFNSTEATLQWRQWVGPRWGYTASVQHYRNPYYRRHGIAMGLFFDF